MISSESIVLVTGATGFTGSYLIRALAQTGCHIRAICRASSNRTELESLGVECFEGNVFDPDVITLACANVTHIFHLAAAYRQSGIPDEQYFLTHVSSTQLLANQVAGSQVFEKFIHISTVGVMGHIENPPADEATPYSPGDLYQTSKAEAEQWVLKHFTDMGIPFAVVRPAAIYGPGDRRLLKLFKLAKLPVVPIIGSTKGLYHLIHVQDLVDFMIHLCALEQVDKPVYICGSLEATSIKDMIATIAQSMGRRPKFIRIPSWPVFLLADMCEALCKWLKIEPPIYRRRVAFFTKDRAFDTSKMRLQARFTPAISDQKGLEQLTEWYFKQGWL